MAAWASSPQQSTCARRQPSTTIDLATIRCALDPPLALHSPLHSPLHLPLPCAHDCVRADRSQTRYEAVSKEVSSFTPKQRRVALKHDEVNTLGELLWKRHNGTYECFGLAEDYDLPEEMLWKDLGAARNKLSDEELVARSLASKALCFQVCRAHTRSLWSLSLSRAEHCLDA
jgi:hypothetical protein